MPGFEYVPKGIGNKVGLLSARVAAQFFVDAREDNLPPCTVPLNFHASVGFVPMGVKDHGAAGIIVSHHQVEHGVIQRAVNSVRVRNVAVIERALPLGRFISGIRFITVQKRKRRLRSKT